MGFVRNFLFRGAGFLIAAQIFLVLCMTTQGIEEKAAMAAKLAVLPIVLHIVAAFTVDNGPREVGHNIMLWAGAGLVAFLGAVYGDSNTNAITFVDVPAMEEVTLGFGLSNFGVVLLAGFAVWLWGLAIEPPVPKLHDIRRR